MSSEVEIQVARWVERAVIGLDLCPFAGAVWKAGRVRIAVNEACIPEEAVQAVLQEAALLLESDPQAVSTTLVVFPSALSDFEAFLDVAHTAESALNEAGAEGVLQIATFHPNYCFGGVASDAAQNFTNRAPFPIIHLLREEEVSEAIDRHPDPRGIPARNIERMESLGREAIRALWELED